MLRLALSLVSTAMVGVSLGYLSVGDHDKAAISVALSMVLAVWENTRAADERDGRKRT